MKVNHASDLDVENIFTLSNSVNIARSLRIFDSQDVFITFLVKHHLIWNIYLLVEIEGEWEK